MFFLFLGRASVIAMMSGFVSVMRVWRSAILLVSVSAFVYMIFRCFCAFVLSCVAGVGNVLVGADVVDALVDVGVCGVLVVAGVCVCVVLVKILTENPDDFQQLVPVLAQQSVLVGRW